MRRLKGFFVSFVLTALLLVVVAFVLYQTKTSVEHIGGAILLVYAVAAFGLAYFGVVYGVSAVWNKSLSTMFPAILTTLLVCVLAGMLGGMLGPRKNKESRS